jgi:hypothetical protein
MEALLLGAVVLGTTLLTQRLKDGGDRGGALGGEVSPDRARIAEGGAEWWINRRCGR